jgi:hypothetical protein
MMTQGRGPHSYENWHAALMGGPSPVAYEYPLFTDAHIIGKDVSEGFGPYKLINTIAFDKTQRRPALVLLVNYHLRFESPSFDKTDEERYHGGHLPDEVAALASLALGIRLKSGGEMRVFSLDDPSGRPIAYGLISDPILPQVPENPILRSAVGQHDLKDARILTTLPTLKAEEAVALIRAARLYQEAVWIVEPTPELSWIMLTSAVETAASVWRPSTESPIDRLRVSRPELESLLLTYGDEGLVLQVAEMMAPYMGATKKFIDFILTFLPAPPESRPEWGQHSWDNASMKKSLRLIYKYRSRALHGGTPFPAPMCMPPMPIGDNGALNETPVGLAASMRGGVWTAEDTPMMLHVYEHIVRGALISWWRSMATVDSLVTKQSAN